MATSRDPGPAPTRDIAAVILAAGRGARLGADKALVTLPDGRGGECTAVERLAAACRGAGAARVIAVRRSDAAPLPAGIVDRVVAVDTEEMIASLRAGLAAAGPAARTLIAPVDHAAVRAATVAAVLAALPADADPADARLALPVCRGRGGHPIAVTAPVVTEILDGAAATLREVLRADPTRVTAVPVEDPFCRRDIDTPAELRAARGALERSGVPVTEHMARHRSRRRYEPLDVADSQLRWLVDSARWASTSSFVQAYAVVAVRDRERKRRCAELCADQRQIHEAPVFLAVCADLAKVAAACRRHGGELGDDWLEVFVEATVDASLFGQNLLLAAESEGLGGCMIGAARNAPRELAAVLGLPRHVYVVFGMTLGWPADDPLPRDRMTLDAVLHDERYAAGAIDTWLDDADARMRAWARAENARDPGGRGIDTERGWTDRMWWLLGRGAPPKGRAELRDALRDLGFGLESRRDRRSD